MTQTDQTVGRPPLSDEESTRRASISMPVSYWEWLERRPERTTSAAIRALIEAEMAREDEAE